MPVFNFIQYLLALNQVHSSLNNITPAIHRAGSPTYTSLGVVLCKVYISPWQCQGGWISQDTAQAERIGRE